MEKHHYFLLCMVCEFHETTKITFLLLLRKEITEEENGHHHRVRNDGKYLCTNFQTDSVPLHQATILDTP